MLIRVRPYLQEEKILKAIDSAGFGDGKYVKEFERKFCERIGAKTAYATDSGRSALFIALKILDIKKGDEIIVPTYICKSVIIELLSFGAVPVLADCSKNDFNVSVEEISKKISKNTKAIIAAHLFGVPCDIEEIAKIAHQNKICFIEDSAQTMNAEVNKKKVGLFGDLSFFSFGFDKPMSIGKGGMLVINNSSLIAKAEIEVKKFKKVSIKKEKKIIKSFLTEWRCSSFKRYKRQSIGKVLVLRFFKFIKLLFLLIRNPFQNSDILMNDLRAKIGIIQLKDVSFVDKKRSESCAYLKSLLNNEAFFQPEISPTKKPVFLRFPIINKSKIKNSDLLKTFVKKGFEVGRWSLPIHKDPIFNQKIASAKNKFENYEAVTKKIIFVPVHYYVEREDIKKIAEIFNSIK